jgi:hypothetical protein
LLGEQHQLVGMAAEQDVLVHGGHVY